MQSAHAPVYKPSMATPARTGTSNAGMLTGLLDELRSGGQGVTRPANIRIAPMAPVAAPARVWIPLPDPPACGLGPSVAELTIGRPPRAPRPEDEPGVVRDGDAPAR